MTKHPEPDRVDARDRPVLEFGEGYNRIVDDYRKALKRFDDTLTLERPSFCESYYKGVLRIAAEFGTVSGPKTNPPRLLAVWSLKSHASHERSGRLPRGVQKVETLNIHNRVCCDEGVMLIGDIKAVDSVKVTAPNLEWLGIIKNETNDLSAREGSCFLSVDGGFRVLPCVSEGEFSPVIDGSSIGLDQSAVSMVEGCMQVVDCVTDDGWRMLGEPSSSASIFPSLRVRLRAQGFDVIHHVGSDNRLKLLDVMIGPFYF